MASSPRDAEREEERRLNLRTLTIASAASAVAAAVTSQLWIAGTWIAAALTPVLVTLISEAIHRPTERISQVRTSRRTAVDRGDPAPVRVYRQGTSRPTRRRLALGVVFATAAIAFVVGIASLTAVDLVSGGSVGKGSGRTTVLGGGGDSTQESAPADTEDREAPSPPADEPETTAPAEPPQDEPPSDTAPLPPPAEPAPGEPAPETVP